MVKTPDSTEGDQFRLAIVGCGLITQNSHLPAALSCRNIRVVALIDPVLERAEALSREYWFAPMHARTLDELDADLDGAVIATPNHTHRDLALACLERGIAVLIEKPLANSVSEGQAVVEAGRRQGCCVAVGYVSRFRPNVVFLKELLTRSYFGRVRRFVYQFGTAGGWSPLSAYNLRRDTSGGGVLVVTGTHFLDRMLHFWGYPNDMTFEDDADGGPEANCVATFQFAGEPGPIDGMVTCSKTARLLGGLVIETDRGTVVVGDTDAADIVFRPNDAPDLEYVVTSRTLASPNGFDTFAEQLADFVEACRTGRRPRVDGEQGLLSLRLIEELYQRRTPLQCDWYCSEPGVTA